MAVCYSHDPRRNDLGANAVSRPEFWDGEFGSPGSIVAVRGSLA